MAEAVHLYVFVFSCLAAQRFASGVVSDESSTRSSDQPKTYLYYYSSKSELMSGKRNTPDVPLLGLYAISLDHRLRSDSVKQNTHTDGVLEMGQPVSIHDNELLGQCAPTEGVSSRSTNSAASTVMAIQSVSFDTVRGRVVLHRRRRHEESKFSLVTARVCPEQRQIDGIEGGCEKYRTAAGEMEIEKVFDDVQIQPATYQIKSFAMHDGTLYFILEVRDRIAGHMKELTIELRRLRRWNRRGTTPRPSSARTSSSDDTEGQAEQRCADLFSSTVTRESYFDVMDCSELLAVVSRETFPRFSREGSLEGLLIVPLDNGMLDFYLQVQQVVYDSSERNVSDVSIVLYHFRYDDESRQAARRRTKSVQETAYSKPESRSVSVAVPIHTVSLDSTEYYRYVLYQRGGMSSRHGLLCWSATNRIMCGRLLSNGSVTDVRMRLTPRLASDVCKGTGLFANVVTGVALIETGPPHDSNLSFYFGCVAETPGMGGAGLFVGGENDPVGNVYRLRSNGSDIHAESMFIATSTTVCPSSSLAVQQLVVAASKTKTGSASYSSSTLAQASRAFPVAVIVTLITSVIRF